MTDEELDAIDARANAATSGEWGALNVGEGKMIAIYQHNPGSGALAYVGADWTDAQADAAFIAHAREDVPALVAEVRRLRAPSLVESQEQ